MRNFSYTLSHTYPLLTSLSLSRATLTLARDSRCLTHISTNRNGQVDIISNDQGYRTTPSYVAFTDDGERLIGEAAKAQSAMNPHNTIFDAKRLIGRDFTDSTVTKDIKHWRTYFFFTLTSPQ